MVPVFFDLARACDGFGAILPVDDLKRRFPHGQRRIARNLLQYIAGNGRITQIRVLGQRSGARGDEGNHRIAEAAMAQESFGLASFALASVPVSDRQSRSSRRPSV